MQYSTYMGSWKPLRMINFLNFLREDYKEEVLPDYGVLYLSHLIARYESTNGDVQKGIADIVPGKKLYQFTWGDLLLIELALLSQLSFEDLIREAFMIRQKYKDVAGVNAYNNYLKTNPPNLLENNLSETLLRSDLKSLMCQINWLYACAPGLKKKRSHLIKMAAIIPTLLLLLVFGSLLATTVFDHNSLDIPIFILVIIAGAFGGLISMQRRLQLTPVNDDPIDDFSNLSNGRFSFFIGPITGAFLALVLYMIFIAGIIQGTLFPHIQSTLDMKNNFPSTITFRCFAEGTGVTSGTDYAKLLVWSFLAGFAERFVPDTLNWLVEKGAAHESSKTAIN